MIPCLVIHIPFVKDINSTWAWVELSEECFVIAGRLGQMNEVRHKTRQKHFGMDFQAPFLFLETYDIDNIKDAKELLKAVVDLYNNERPHMSISNFTPNHIHGSKTIAS
jgi:hypothetical protein